MPKLQSLFQFKVPLLLPTSGLFTDLSLSSNGPVCKTDVQNIRGSQSNS